MASVKPLWPDENTEALFKYLDSHLEDFKPPLSDQAFEMASRSIPHNPRTMERYTVQQIKAKLHHMKHQGKNGEKVHIDVLLREGSKCLRWQPKIRKAEEDDTKAKKTLLDDSVCGSVASEINSRPSGPLQPDVRFEANYNEAVIRTSATSQPNNFSGMRDSIVQATNKVPDNYIDLVLQAHEVSDNDVKDEMRSIRQLINIVIASIFRNMDLTALKYPQLDIIQKRFHDTSVLLHHTLGLPMKGSLSDKVSLLGFGQISLIDLLTALIGMAIHDWVFKSDFPTAVTCPDNSLKMMDRILSKYGLHALKQNLLSDIRYYTVQDQSARIQEEASQLAIRLGFALAPMLTNHDDRVLQFPAANMGQPPKVWEEWRSHLHQMFAKCLQLKSSLEVDSELFEYKWPVSNDVFNNGMMDTRESTNAEDKKVLVALLSAITAPDRSGQVISNALVILQ